LVAIRGCILEPARIWQPPQQGNTTNIYVGHHYNNLPACWRQPRTNHDLVAIRGCILEPARIWQPPQQGNTTNAFSHHRYRQSKITFIDKQDHISRQARITSSFKLLSLGFVRMESWENCLNQAVSDSNQASQAGFSGNNTWLKKTEWGSSFWLQ
jgi:hypothetical protein